MVAKEDGKVKGECAKGFPKGGSLLLYIMAAGFLCLGICAWYGRQIELSDARSAWNKDVREDGVCLKEQDPAGWLLAGRADASAAKRQSERLPRLPVYLYGLAVCTRAFCFSERTLLAVCIRSGRLYPLRFLYELFIQEKKDGKKWERLQSERITITTGVKKGYCEYH